MTIQPELECYKAPADLDKAAVDGEIEKLRSSLPYYFLSVKYNCLMFLIFASNRKNRKEMVMPKYNYSGDEFAVFIENGNTFIRSYRENKWFFEATDISSDNRVEISDPMYIDSLNMVFWRIYGLKYLFPRLFAKVR